MIPLLVTWRTAALPAIMSERTVGFRHAVGVLTLLHRGAAVVGSVEKLGRQPVDHGLVVAVARGGDDPADRQRLTAVGADFDRHLVCRAADAARAHLHSRRDVLERLLEHRE